MTDYRKIKHTCRRCGFRDKAFQFTPFRIEVDDGVIVTKWICPKCDFIDDERVQKGA